MWWVPSIGRLRDNIPEDGGGLLQDQGGRPLLEQADAASGSSATGGDVAIKATHLQGYPSIGESFGGRDHTTVLHAVRTIESLRAKDNELNHDVHVLLQVLKG